MRVSYPNGLKTVDNWREIPGALLGVPHSRHPKVYRSGRPTKSWRSSNELHQPGAANAPWSTRRLGRGPAGALATHNLGKLIRRGQTVNTSLTRECLELILKLADALDRKKAKQPITLSQRVAPVELISSDRLEAVRD
jgi:hypothetical protein